MLRLLQNDAKNGQEILSKLWQQNIEEGVRYFECRWYPTNSHFYQKSTFQKRQEVFIAKTPWWKICCKSNSIGYVIFIGLIKLHHYIYFSFRSRSTHSSAKKICYGQIEDQCIRRRLYCRKRTLCTTRCYFKVRT